MKDDQDKSTTDSSLFDSSQVKMSLWLLIKKMVVMRHLHFHFFLNILKNKEINEIKFYIYETNYRV